MRNPETSREDCMQELAVSLLINPDIGADNYVCTRNDLSKYPGTEIVVESICEELRTSTDAEPGHHEVSVLAGLNLQLKSELRDRNVTIGDSQPKSGQWIREEDVESLAELIFCAAVHKRFNELSSPDKKKTAKKKPAAITGSTRRKVAKKIGTGPKKASKHK